MAKELEQFLGRGNERAFWVFTYKNAAGAVLGGFLASRIGQMMGGGGLLFLMSIVGLVVGMVVTLDRRGMMWFRRWAIVGKFYLQRALKRDDFINATALYEVVELREQPIVIRKGGKTIVTTSQTDRNVL
jgi:hypothetical protein